MTLILYFDDVSSGSFLLYARARRFPWIYLSDNNNRLVPKSVSVISIVGLHVGKSDRCKALF